MWLICQICCFVECRQDSPEWGWVQERAWLGSRWAWLQAQVSELEYRIRGLSDLYAHLRQGKVQCPTEAYLLVSPVWYSRGLNYCGMAVLDLFVSQGRGVHQPTDCLPPVEAPQEEAQSLLPTSSGPHRSVKSSAV